MQSRPVGARFRHFASVDAVEPVERGLLAHLHGERLRIEFVRDDVVRLKISRGGAFDEQPTAAVVAEPAPVRLEHDGLTVRSAQLAVTLSEEPFAIRVERADGSLVLETGYATLNDEFILRRPCGPDDAFYGLGEKGGPGDRRGRSLRLWNTDILNPYAVVEPDGRSPDADPLYISIPLVHHQRGPGGPVGASFVDNGYASTYDFTAADEYVVHFAGGQYTEYVFAGPRMPEVVEAYTWLTGRPALPPRWALGYHQCRWERYTETQLEALARRHRDEGVPCDALWLDIDHMDGYRVFTWDHDAYPDPPAMLARLAAEGTRVVTIVDPGVKAEAGYAVYDEAVERDVLCRTEGGDVYLGEVWPGDTAFPDFALPEARAWWAQHNAAWARGGVAGIWNDMNEPATGANPPERMRFARGTLSHERLHNQYALLMATATVEGLREARPHQRPFVLSRAGSAGIQRVAANWMGDNQSRWDHLRVSIAMACGLGVSGQPFVGADIGGFQGDSSPELFARWMQYGALTPFCRNHCERGYVDQYVWSFGDDVLAQARDALRLRYRLLPYLYAAFVRAADTGAPVQRPLAFDYGDEPDAGAVDDQYLLGPDLLVAPITEPGRTERDVYLPAGDWYDWHTGECHRGGRRVGADAPPQRIPVFARAGAVIPMWPQAPLTTAGYEPDSIELHVFVPLVDGTWESLLQEDDGETVDGPRLRTTLRLTRSGGELTLEARAEGEPHPQFAREAFRVVLHGGDGERTIANRGEAFSVRLAP